MKKLLAAAIFILPLVCKAQPDAPRLIIRGDDMGFSHSGNDALVKCFREGIMTSVEVIVPSPWFPEAVKLLRDNPGLDVGIHVAFTSEWDNVKWRPLTDCASLKDKDGYFYPKVYASKEYPGQAILEHTLSLADVEKELRAQIEMAIRYIPRISHASGHMGCLNMTPEVKSLVTKILKEYRFELASEPLRAPFDGPHKTPGEKVQTFLAMLDKLEKGKTYVFVEHPGLDNEELRAIHHIGYEDVAADRQGVTELFTNEEVKAAIRKKGIRLISYKELATVK